MDINHILFYSDTFSPFSRLKLKTTWKWPVSRYFGENELWQLILRIPPSSCSSIRGIIRHPSKSRSINLDGRGAKRESRSWISGGNESQTKVPSGIISILYRDTRTIKQQEKTTVGYIGTLEFRVLTGSWRSFTLVYVCKRIFMINVKL